MSKNIVKTKAEAFLREYKIKEVNVPTLKSIIKKQGYTIVEYNGVSDERNVDALLTALKLKSFAEKSKGFTYADEKHRLVFLHEDLSEKEKLIVLSHEEGHIYCEHFSSAPIIGKNVTDENEANEFSHYILNRSIPQKIKSFIGMRKKFVIALLVALIVLISGIFTIKTVRTQQSYFGEFYITSTGNKYHEKDCIFVKDKTNTHRMTKEEFDSGEYEPCGICLPDS